MAEPPQLLAQRRTGADTASVVSKHGKALCQFGEVVFPARNNPCPVRDTLCPARGTAQVAGLSQEDEKPDALLDIPKRLRDHALFVAFAPADNPQIAIAVVAEHSGGGGAVAAPIARQVLDEHFSSNAQAGPVSASGVSDNNSTSLVP